jgi:hypothetical protein
MNEINEVMRRLREGESPTPQDTKAIIKDLRRQRALYKGGKEPKNDDDEQKNEVLKVFASTQPPKPKLVRRA